MKTVKLLLLLVAVAMTVASCNTKKEMPKSEPQKALVLYYSQTSNTKTVAQEIANKLGADIEEITLPQPYDGDFQATIARSMQEREKGETPAINPIAANIADYDVVFLGYPIWFGTYAPPIATLLDSIDFAGKNVALFCTFGSGGLDSSEKDFAAKQPKANIVGSYGVRTARIAAVAKEVDQFLKSAGFIEGEYFKPAPFGELQPVTETETNIFNAAVGDYPMIHAEAKAFAQRPAENGTEYLFKAVDLPRDGNQAAPATELTIYVLVANGEAPVFTQVVR
ncbi:MAG: NAD(P)H-dependent oxidoreductase [Bacteroidales bacterium]|nr:NAD(P)H-dependent oxidoreductase [Bacteroidales bacterium]